MAAAVNRVFVGSIPTLGANLFGGVKMTISLLFCLTLFTLGQQMQPCQDAHVSRLTNLITRKADQVGSHVTMAAHPLNS